MRSLHSVIESWMNALSKALITHSQAVKSGTIVDICIASNFLNGYSRNQQFGLAHKLFDEMPYRDTVSWNTMITGYVNCGKLEIAWEFLRNMRRSGFELDGYTFGSILKGVACSHRWDIGEEVHSMIIKMGYTGNVYSRSALLDMYAKCEQVEEAYVVFEHMPDRNSVSWNALIAGFVQVGDRGTAFWLFGCMEKEAVKSDDGTIAPLLMLLDDSEFYETTMQIHGKIRKLGLEFSNTVCNVTITSYSKCGSVEDAKKVFDRSFSTRDVVTWNSMLAAYLIHGKEGFAFNILMDMQRLGF